MKNILPPVADKGTFFIAVSQFGSTFSMNFVAVFMPFYILKISHLGPQATMIWTGMIIGVSSLMAALMAPVWGQLTSRFRPKLLLERAILCNGMVILLYGFAENLYVLFFLRVLIGLLGGTSTVGLILISALSPKDRLHKDISLYQIAQTMGQLFGPPSERGWWPGWGIDLPLSRPPSSSAAFLSSATGSSRISPLARRRPRSAGS